MNQKLTRLKQVLLTLFLGTILICLGASGAHAQTTDLPKDHPIKIAAPHLPLLERHTGEGQAFYGEKFVYKSESQVKIKEWAGAYPAELEAYKVAIEKYLKDTDPATLSETAKETYYDLKAQSMLISQLN